MNQFEAKSLSEKYLEANPNCQNVVYGYRQEFGEEAVFFEPRPMSDKELLDFDRENKMEHVYALHKKG